VHAAQPPPAAVPRRVACISRLLEREETEVQFRRLEGTELLETVMGCGMTLKVLEQGRGVSVGEGECGDDWGFGDDTCWS